MDIFNSIGKGFEDLSNQVKDLGKRSIYEAKEASKATKLKIQIHDLEMKIQAEFAHLGEVYYMEMREQTHLTDTSSSELLLAIDELQKEKDALQNRVRTKGIEGEEFDAECPECHAKIDEDANFCPNCGKKIEFVHFVDEDPDFIECENCHFQAERGSTYCPRCGTPLV
ncbi:MAG: zinc ribbon domain-containing protein [Peptoniphilus sp.]|nr:zinc ribbon domain-containing protein [Peptoniphilus sp.]MDD7362593.1 zinc ribbon domain-containing protein [Bacillota bacterium]MDY6045008.1 zinc ribbon domain-containing protein [Peptoniphilus sp.]